MFKGQNGMSLIQVMIALGLMSVIGLGVAELMVTSAKISKRSDAKLSQLILMNEMQSIISSEQVCSDMINSVSQEYNETEATGDGWDVEFKLTSTQTLKNGTKFNNNLVVKRLYIKQDGVSTVVPPPPGVKTYIGRIFIEFDTTSDKMLGGSFRDKEAGIIFLTVDATDKVISCSKVPENSIADICTKLGGKVTATGCSGFNYTGCTSPNMGHGTSYTQNYSSGGKNCFRTYTCIDGRKIKTTDFCEESTVTTAPPSGPSGDECTPGQTRTISSTCPNSGYYGGQQNQRCIDGYWVDNGGIYGCTWSCFIAETKIKLFNGQDLLISQVQVGDYVLGEDGAINEVYDIEVVPLDGRRLFSFNDGPHFVTAEHPFKTTLGWKSFSPERTYQEHFFKVKNQPLEAGDLMYREGKTVEMLKKISTRHDKSNLMVYNLRLKAAPNSPYDNSDERSNTYFANGYLVHNK